MTQAYLHFTALVAVLFLVGACDGAREVDYTASAAFLCDGRPFFEFRLASR